MQIRVREACPIDADAIARVHIDTWRSAYRDIVPDAVLESLSYEKDANQWKRVLGGTEHRDFFYVVEDASQSVVGFASGGPALGGNDPQYSGELFTIYILYAFQRQGLGHLLFSQVVKHLISLNLTSMLIWVLADNPARCFYEALGGNLVDTGTYEIEGVVLNQVAYGWTDITQLVSSHRTSSIDGI